MLSAEPGDMMLAAWLIVLSLLLLGTLVGVWGYLRARFACPLLFDLVAYAALLKVLLNFLLPAVLRGWSDWSFDRAVSVRPVEIATVYAIEVGSYFIWLAGIAAVTALPGFRKRVQKARAGAARRNLGAQQAPAQGAGGRAATFLNRQGCSESTARLFLGL